ncbi:MAG: hypothetical protein QOG84_1560 [Sphingomonadales bacterium]|jgi:hypothetical protein|nr:hypothetical protein [Sphingomonadales bacterium]
MKRLALLLPLALVACQKPAPPAAKETEPRRAEPAPPPRTEAGDDAARMLRRYYDLIEAGRYDDAYALRSGGGADRERFAANFRAYESYQAQFGAPSQPVSQGDFEFVEVPVMITGRFVGGKPFGSTGSVTLRRARTGADRSWRVYTG